MEINESRQPRDAVAVTAWVMRNSFLKAAVIAAVVYLTATVSPLSAQQVGPSTTVDPYLLPSIADMKTASILTVGNLPAANGYKMVGIPDGLAVIRNGREFTLLMNHELGENLGIQRAHGSTGAFVSRWSINRKTLEVLKGEDLTQSPNDVFLWDPVSKQYQQGTTKWNRLCSADLASEDAYFYRDLGTRDRIYLNGEETNEGRAWARIATGQHRGEAWQLPRFGKTSYENAVASSYPQRKTVVMLLDDANLNTAGVAANFPSEVYAYVGIKQRRGHPVERAGLTNGKLYAVKVFLEDETPVTEENNDFGLGNAGTGFKGSGKFTLVELGANGDVSNLSALQLEQASIDANVFRMRRVEDGAWDSRRRHKDDFYFVTTGNITTNSRLWRLRFDDIEKPEKGGKIEILLKGDEGHRMLDNLTIDGCGRILMQEDPGNNARVAKIWLYGIQSKNLVEVAHHNPKFFDPALADPDFITQDEESSGIVDAERILGKGWFLLDVQVHTASHLDPASVQELVEGGQLLAMQVDSEFECAAEDDDEADDND